jgi:RNA polymerase sigma factor (TIGR02999 family)
MTAKNNRAANITELLRDWGEGNMQAMDKLLPLVYDDLRRSATLYLRRERPDHTLQPTALVNEAYLRLVDQRNVVWKNRGHFLAIAAQAMRRILVDHARSRNRKKRGGSVKDSPLEHTMVGPSGEDEVDVIALDEALSRLATLDARQERLVELRYFVGLSLEEAAEVLDISRAKATREWMSAKGLVVSRTNALGIHMSATEWQIVKEIFYKALSFDAEARDQYLDDACRDNVELRAEVESLLGSMGKAESFLEKPAAADATTIVSDSHLKTGQQISHYKIVSHLASGGMGEVYLAEDQSLPRKVALKILPEQAFPDSDQVRRFKSEANAISALNHPNILTIFEFDSEDGIHLLVSEYVEGETLRERIRRGRLTVPEAVEMSVQIVSALNAAHGAGIIHRDVKPENIMIRADGYVKVLDFGLAKLTDIERPDENAVTLLQAGEPHGHDHGDGEVYVARAGASETDRFAH